MNELTDDQKKLLKAPLPKEAVKPHPTKSYLSSIKAIYVTERMNDVFGVGAWRVKVEHQANGEKGMVVVKVIFEVPQYGIYYESFGGNDNGGEGSKNFDLGDAYKGATTDAITKIGSYLGIGIDVFKGLNTPPPSKGDNKPEGKPPKNDPTEKPWLNPGDKNWKNAVDALAGRAAKKDGSPFVIADIEAKYRISKANKDQLLNEAMQ